MLGLRLLPIGAVSDVQRSKYQGAVQLADLTLQLKQREPRTDDDVVHVDVVLIQIGRRQRTVLEPFGLDLHQRRAAVQLVCPIRPIGQQVGALVIAEGRKIVGGVVIDAIPEVSREARVLRPEVDVLVAHVRSIHDTRDPVVRIGVKNERAEVVESVRSVASSLAVFEEVPPDRHDSLEVDLPVHASKVSDRQGSDRADRAVGIPHQLDELTFHPLPVRLGQCECDRRFADDWHVMIRSCPLEVVSIEGAGWR